MTGVTADAASGATTGPAADGTTSGSDDVPELVLTGAWTPIPVLAKRVWAARELVLILGRKNFFVQYRRASLGTLWAVGLPLLQAVLFAVIFRRIGRFDVPHYPVFVFSGMAAWTFFITTIVPGATAIVDNSALSSKVYFPRAVLPLSLVVGSCYTLAATVMVLLGFAVLAGADFGVRLLWLVPGVTLDVLLTVTMCLVLSVSHVYLRDTRYVVQALAVGWLWVTPVVYPLATLHGWVRALVEANPVTGVAQLFHAALVTDVGALWPAWVTVAWIAGLAAVGTVLNARYDRVVSDLL